MNNGWPIVTLGEVLTHRKQFVTIDDTQQYKRCRVQLHAKGVTLRDVVAGAAVKTKSQQICRAGDFLVAEIDAKVGGFGIIPLDLDGAIVSSHYFLFQICQERLDRRVLDYYVRTPQFRDQVAARGSTNYAAIRPADVLGYTMPLPQLSEQRRIVAKIDQLAAHIDEARGLRTKSQASSEALAHSARREPFMRRDGWRVVTLETACEAIIDCPHSNPVYAETGVPTVRSPDVGWGRILVDQARRTSETEYERRTRRGEIRPGDIVLVREGGGTGKAGIVEAGQRFSLGQRVMLLRPKPATVEPRFMLHQWLSPLIYRDQITDRIKGSASPHLNIKALRQFDFVLPPLGEQRRIVARLDSIQDQLQELKSFHIKTAAELDALLPSILDRAFKGEL